MEPEYEDGASLRSSWWAPRLWPRRAGLLLPGRERVAVVGGDVVVKVESALLRSGSVGIARQHGRPGT